MKVLIYGMSSRHGGVESFIYNYYQFLSNDFKIDFVTDYESIPFESEIKEKGSKIYKLPSRSKHPIKYREALKEIFANNDYQIVWANVTTLSTIELLVQAKKHSVPVRIVHSHNSENMGTLRTKILHSINHKRIVNYATDYWACSKEAGEWMFSSIVDPDNVTVINNAIVADDFIFNPKVRKEKRSEIGIKENEFIVGTVGRFHHQKNHFFLLDIMKEIVHKEPNAHLLMVGDGPLKEETVAYIEEMGLTNSVSLLGQRGDVPELLQAFDVFLLPSRFEGLPFVLVEAQASGLPCVGSNKVMSPDTKITSLLEFVDLEKSAEHWAKRVLNKKDSVRANMKEEIVLAGFDIESQAKKLSDDFNKMIKERIK